MRRRFRLIFSGSCALLAALLCVLYGDSTREEAERARAEALERYGGEVVRLVVATEGIEAGEVVDHGNVAERDWVSDLAPVDAVTGIDSVLGSEVSVPVAAGVPLTSLNFRDAGDAIDVPADKVALSVPVGSELGMVSSVEVGATVAAYEVSESGVSLIADDLQVLSVPQATSGFSSSASLVAAVSPKDVAAVLEASGEGSLRLALPGDEALGLSEQAPTAPTEVPAEKSGGGSGSGSTGGATAGGDGSTGGTTADGDGSTASGESGGGSTGDAASGASAGDAQGEGERK